MNNEIIQYVKETRGKNRGQRRGIIVARPVKNGEFNTGVVLGWSYTRIGKGDKFDLNRGLEIARGRCDVSNQDRTYPTKVPHAVNSMFNRMEARAKKYFKVQ